MLVSTKKLPLNEYSKIEKNSYTKGSYCFYIGNQKGKSIEQIIDILVPKGNENDKRIFVFDNFKSKEIYIIFVHQLVDTIVIKMNFEAGKENEFSWAKFNSIIKSIMIKNKCDNILILESSKISKDKITAPLVHIEDSKFALAEKKAPKLTLQITYAIKSIVVIIVFILATYGQSAFFYHIKKTSTQEFDNKRASLLKEKASIQKEITRIQEQINEMPTVLAQTMQEVVIGFNNGVDENIGGKK